MKQLVCNLLFFIISVQLYATKYYCDPIAGKMDNKGSYKSPWSRLDSVFLTNKKLLPGDTLVLRTGFHGFPIIKGNLNTNGYVTIIAEKRNVPTFKKIVVSDAQKWIIKGLSISPETAGLFEKGDYISIKATASEIKIENCNIYSTEACINSWTSATLFDRFGIGIRVEGKYCTISNNVIKQVVFGIIISKSATHSLVSNNVIYGFLNDGMRGLSDDSVFEYNSVAGSYGIDDNHDDAFQSWSTDDNGKVGMGKVKNVVLRGNLLISQVDPKQPFTQERGMQGIGNFDGFFENWTIENNLIITNMWHGIALFGAINCTIRNNTVLKNPLSKLPFSPWIAIYNHKNKSESSGNTIINNTAKIEERAGVVNFSGNVDLEKKEYGSFFISYEKFQKELKAQKGNSTAGIQYLKAMMVDLKKLRICTN